MRSELLVVLFIISILVSLVVGVAKYVYDEAGRKQTQTTQTIVMSAIEAFHDITGDYPDGNIVDLVRSLKGDGVAPPLDAEVKKEAGEKLLELPKDALDLSTTGATIRDGFGYDMQYERDGGLGGRPVLISPGPDGSFTEEEDDIRSDEH